MKISTLSRDEKILYSYIIEYDNFTCGKNCKLFWSKIALSLKRKGLLLSSSKNFKTKFIINENSSSYKEKDTSFLFN